MKKALIHTLFAFVIVEIIISKQTLLQKKDSSFIYTQAVVVYQEWANRKYLKLIINNEDYLYKAEYLHTYLFLELGEVVDVAYKTKNNQKIDELKILGFWHNYFRQDQLILKPFLFVAMFSALYLFSYKQEE